LIGCRHPVVNEYAPSRFKGETFLRPAGDLRDKLWDEEALRRWEAEVNNGKPWEGRKDVDVEKLGVEKVQVAQSDSELK
jgi:hypothetical protein